LQYEIEIGGHARQIIVTRRGDRFAVVVDGTPWDVEVAVIDAQTLSLIAARGRPDAGVAEKGSTARSYEVTVVRDPLAPERLLVSVGSRVLAVTANGRRHQKRRTEEASAGPQRIVSPMPGKIVRVLVQPGDAVSARQPLVVVEAMKMENELRALRDGIVRDVHVKKGASVEAGTPLVLVE
jgi:biotin carboxyl carrier protein